MINLLLKVKALRLFTELFYFDERFNRAFDSFRNSADFLRK